MIVWFILGIIFMIIINPILYSVQEVIVTKFDKVKAKDCVDIIKYNIESERMKDQFEQETREVSNSVIGFEAPSEYYYDDDDDDLEDKKRPIGF